MILNSEIRYNISNDYNKLYELLKNGDGIIGYTGIDINDDINMSYSKLIHMSYNNKNKSFYLGFVLFESDLTEINFSDICRKYNIRYIPY